jgi:hypothetical protein
MPTAPLLSIRRPAQQHPSQRPSYKSYTMSPCSNFGFFPIYISRVCVEHLCISSQHGVWGDQEHGRSKPRGRVEGSPRLQNNSIAGYRNELSSKHVQIVVSVLFQGLSCLVNVSEARKGDIDRRRCLVMQLLLILCDYTQQSLLQFRVSYLSI